MRRWILAGVGALIVVAAVAVVASGSLDRSGATTGVSPTPLPPVPPADRVVAEARTVPVASASVSARVPGSVARVAIAEGDRVAVGDVLVELDDAAVSAQVDAARAGVDAATAAATRADAAAAQADAEVSRAAAALRGARAARDALPSDASTALERQADAQVDAAAAGLDAARAARSAANAANAGAAADAARARATLDAAVAAAAATVITAPIAGLVADMAVSAGDVVAAGAPLVRIAGDGGWEFETTDLTQDEVAGVAVGADATVTIDGFAGDIPATVVSIAAYGVDRQGDVVFTAIVKPVGEVPGGVRWNMVASVEIATTP